MKSKIFYGPFEQSIRERLFKEVNNNYDKFSKHIVIVPERFTLNAESMLLDALDVKSTFKCEVLSINRLCLLVGASQDLTKQEGILIIYRLLVEHQSKLKFFNINDGRMGFAEEIYESIMQFKSSLVTPSELNTNGSELLKAKLEDIGFIYKAYEDYLAKNGVYDGSNKINSLVEQIKTNKFFEDCAVYFVGFESLTALNLQVLNAFIVRGLPVFCGALYVQGSLNEHIYLNDLYTIYTNLLESVDYESIYVPADLSDTFKHLLDNAYAYHPLSIPLQNEISLYKCEDAFNEVVRLKQQIHSFIRQGYRYKDINILVSDVSKYNDIVRAVFDDIPYYIDTTTSLETSEIARFILAILEAVNFGYSYDEWFRIVNNYYLGIDESQRLEVNNYLHLYRPSGLKWLKDVEQIKVFDKLTDVFTRIRNCVYVDDYIDVIKFTLNQFDVETLTLNLINEKDDLYVQKMLKKSFQVISSMLDTLQKVCLGLKVSLADFITLFSSGLKEANISLVPLAVDAVFIGDQSSYFLRKSIFFVLGAKLGDLPNERNDCGILTDRELDNITSRYKIEPKISELNMRSKVKILQLIATAQKLVIMYPNISGDSVNKQSQILDTISNCFSIDGKKLPILSFDATELIEDVVALAEQLDDKQGVISYALDESKDKLKATVNELITELGYQNELLKYSPKERPEYLKSKMFFSKGYTSISEIKEYFDCPYKHFLSRGLKLKKVDPLKMRNIDVGNILHRIAEVYCKSLKTNVNKTKILEQVLGEFEEVIKVTSPIILKGLKKEALRLMGAVENYVASSDYMPTFFEYNFPNMKLNLETKYGQLEVRGKIDRIDVCKDRFLLIDYKTSNMEFDSKGLYYGTKLQLPFYSYFFDKNTDKRLSGFAYFPIVDNFESEKVVNYKMNGLYVNDIDVVSSLDKNLHFDETNESKFFDIKYTTFKTTQAKLSSNCLKQSTLDCLCEYAYKVCVKAVEEMIEGYIAISPNETERVCEFCDYQGICMRELCVKSRNARSVDYEIIEELIKGDKNGV